MQNNNQAIFLMGDFYAYVNGKLYGPFQDLGSAQAGVKVEERRAMAQLNEGRRETK